MLYTAAVITRFFTDGGDWIYQSWRQLSITLTILIGRPASISTPFINGWWVLERARKCFQGCCRRHLSLLDECKLKLIQAPEKTTPLTYIFMGSTGTNNWEPSNNPEFMTWVTLKLMALPSSPFCVNWSHKANTDKHIQWWDLMRLLWLIAGTLPRDLQAHTRVEKWWGWLLCALVADSQYAAVACSTSGCVAWYKSSGRCHESTHVHTPWNTRSEPGRGRELSHPMLDSHLKLNFYFLVAGRTSTLHFPLQKSWI